MMNPSSSSKCVGLLSRQFSNLALSTISSTTLSTTATATTTANKSFSTLAWKLRNCSRNIAMTSPPTTITAMMMNTNNNNKSTTTQYQYQQQRTKVSNRKVIDAKNAKRLKIQQKKKKGNGLKTTTATTTATAVEGEGGEGEGEGETGNTESSTSSTTPFLQHAEWVKFQQSITVDGFQTGQTTTATVLKKSRGGKQARRKREKELARLGGDGLVDSLAGSAGQQKISAVAAKFPALRYSVEETEELLKLAYATLPTRTGKRGTRNLKRQANRWKIVRKIRSDYKAQLLRAHYRRMLQRKYKRDRTKVAMHDAIDQRQSDLEYQGQVLQRWRNMSNNNGNSSSSGGDHEIGSGGDLVENKI